MLAVGSDVRGNLQYALRLELASPWTNDMLQERLGLHDRGPCTLVTIAGNPAGMLLVLLIGSLQRIRGHSCDLSAADMPGFIERGQEPIGLPRDVQRLVAATDRLRIFTACCWWSSCKVLASESGLEIVKQRPLSLGLGLACGEKKRRLRC